MAISDVIEAMLDFGTIASSKLGDAFADVLVKIVGDIDDDGVDESHEEASLFQHSAILHRPLPPDDDGETECVYWRRGDEFIALATRDRRWQIDIDEGEVIVRGYGDGAPMIRLDPTGVAYVLAPSVRIEETKDGTVEGIALGDSLKTYLDSLKSWVDSHTHITTATAGTGPVGTIATPLPASPTVPTVASSKHQVEP